jgi:HSP20 family protein
MTLYISPYRRIARLRDAMDRLWDENLAENSQSERELTLAIDVVSEEDGYAIRAFVPGLDSEDLNIEILNNTITLRGEFKLEEQESAKYIASELPQGRFSRVISLPVGVDASKAEASLKNGVLVLRVPKAEAHRPKTIKVSAVS